MHLSKRVILHLGLFALLLTSGTAMATVPANPPALPTPAYTGATHAARINKATSARIVDNLFLATTLAQVFMGELPQTGLGGRAAVIDQTLKGPYGGSAQVQGRIKGPSSGWLLETFSNFKFGSKASPFNANGSVLIEQSGSKVTYGWKAYHVTGDETDIQYDGAVTSTLGAPGAAVSSSLLMNFSVKDKLRDLVQDYSGFHLLNYGNGDLTKTTLNGKVYNQSLGYVDVVTKSYLYFRPSRTLYYPVSGGEIVATGAGVSAFHIVPLNSYVFSVGLDKTGTGTVTQAARFSWSTGLADVTPNPDGSGSPVAVAKQTGADAALFPTGSRVILEGRFSHSPIGVFLSYAWSIRQAPLGSTAALSGSVTGTTASFKPDVPGDYLIELDVSDGSNSASDVAVVSVATPAAMPNTAVTGDGGYKMDPVASGTVGDEIKLDGRDTTLGTYVAGAFGDRGGVPTYLWTLTAPTGSTAKLSGANGATPHFVPDVPGYYTVTLSASLQFQWIDFGKDTEVIAVGTDLKFDPGVRLTPADFHADPYAVADLDGDGLPDIVATITGGMGISSGLYVYHNAGAGEFTQIKMTPFTDTATNIAVGDLDGNGRADIAIAFSDSVEVWLQNTDGSFADPVTLTYSDACGASVSHVDIVRLVTAGANSLVAQGCAGLEVWNYSGGFGSASKVTLVSGINNYMAAIAFADLTGSGNLDAVGQGVVSTKTGIYLAAGDGSGAFGSPSLVTLSGLSGQFFTTADLDGDTYPDLSFAAVSNSAYVIDTYKGSSSGLAASPTAYALSAPATLGSPPVVADVNGDGRVDLLVPGSGADFDFLGILEQQPDGSFGPEVLYPGLGTPVVVDLNGDGVPDIVTFEDGLIVHLGHP